MKNKHIILAKKILEKSNRRVFGLSVSNHIVQCSNKGMPIDKNCIFKKQIYLKDNLRRIFISQYI